MIKNKYHIIYNYNLKKEAIRKVLFMKGDLQIAPTKESKTTDFQQNKILKYSI